MRDARDLDHLDFPAAHSMDTDWFGVDLDGNVAFFHSGEEGAVPWSIDNDETRRIISEICAVRGRELVAAVVNDEEGEDRHDAPWQMEGSFLVYPRFLDVPRYFAADIAAGSVRVLSAYPALDVLLVTPGPDVAVRLAFLHDVDGCAGCYDARHFADWLITTRPQLMPSFGLYVYEHHQYDPTADYQRSEGPAAPDGRSIVVDDLPAAIAARLVRLGTRFRTQRQVHPADHVACRTYGGDDLEPGWRR